MGCGPHNHVLPKEGSGAQAHTAAGSDLARDPGEQRDLSRQSPDLARSLAAEARAWLTSRALVSLAGEETRVGVDADERKWLESLGYVK